MTSIPREWEGTWEEIAAHAPELAGRRLRVSLVSPEDSEDDPRQRILEEIVARSRSMNPKPDKRDYLREGRAGAMFGE